MPATGLVLDLQNTISCFRLPVTTALASFVGQLSASQAPVQHRWIVCVCHCCPRLLYLQVARAAIGGVCMGSYPLNHHPARKAWEVRVNQQSIPQQRRKQHMSSTACAVSQLPTTRPARRGRWLGKYDIRSPDMIAVCCRSEALLWQQKCTSAQTAHSCLYGRVFTVALWLLSPPQTGLERKRGCAAACYVCRLQEFVAALCDVWFFCCGRHDCLACNKPWHQLTDAFPCSCPLQDLFDATFDVRTVPLWLSSLLTSLFVASTVGTAMLVTDLGSVLHMIGGTVSDAAAIANSTMAIGYVWC
jgi:hypothetical protein